MTARADVVARAESYDGYDNGAGYDGPNRFSAELHRSPEAWCGDAVTAWYLEAGVPLPAMQTGCATGFAYCPDALAYGRAHNAVVASWQAQPADLALFDWNGDGVADHVELVEAWSAGVLHTIGGNSGPSNVDQFRSAGGVHRHAWTAPAGIGSGLVLGVLNADKLVAFHPPAPTPPAFPGRLLELKSPMMSGADVKTWQARMATRGWRLAADGVYGPASRAVCVSFQQEKRLGVDGIVGPATWAAAWSSPVT